MTDMPTYAARLKRARKHKGLNQTELAALLGLKPQAIQYLEEEKNAARGSKHTANIARICGVDAHWLASGEGQMLLADNKVQQQEATYGPGGANDAREVAIAWSKLSPGNQQWVREMVFILAAVDTRFPWFRRGRPAAKSYDVYERGIETNYQAQIVLAAGKIKGK